MRRRKSAAIFVPLAFAGVRVHHHVRAGLGDGRAEALDLPRVVAAADAHDDANPR
jgi:hypothetical protein